MFHAQDGFYFHRNGDGSVTVQVTETPKVGSPVLRGIDLEPSAWASVVAAVCARNETGETYREALAFHEATE